MSHIKQIEAGIRHEQGKNGGDMVASCDEHCHEEFSWRRCEICNGLPGERHKAALIYPGTTKEPIEYSVCSCCILYLANGDICDCTVIYLKRNLELGKLLKIS